MTLEAGGGGSSKPSGGGGGGAIPTHSGGGGGGRGGSGRIPGPAKAPRDTQAMSGAERRAYAREDAARSRAAKRYRDQAGNLEMQARALRLALTREFGSSLRIKLANVDRVLADQDAILMEGYRDRVGSLRGAAADNEKAAAGQTVAAESNRLRERSNAVSEAMAQGAGESDLLRSQMMSLHNWNANQSEVTRSFFDTLRSVNSSLTDLNVDTKTGRVNQQVQANADKEQLWTNYYNQRSEAQTQLGNIRGQQADYYAMADEMGSDKGGAKRARRQAKDAYHDSAVTAGKAWKNPGVGDALMEWQGAGPIEGTLTAAHVEATPTATLEKKPEGATLRKW